MFSISVGGELLADADNIAGANEGVEGESEMDATTAAQIDRVECADADRVKLRYRGQKEVNTRWRAAYCYGSPQGAGEKMLELLKNSPYAGQVEIEVYQGITERWDYGIATVAGLQVNGATLLVNWALIIGDKG